MKITLWKFLTFLVFGTTLQAQAQISPEQFQNISQAFQAEFSAELAQQNARLNINRPPSPQMPNFWWDLNERHASYSAYTDANGFTEHFLFLFGGYARMPGMTPDGVVMTLCHELGHGIGGAPYKRKTDNTRASTEGQSDYFAARSCIKRVLKYIPEFQPAQAPNAYTENLCRQKFVSAEDLYNCFRGFQALEVERIFFRQLANGGGETDYHTPDLTVVDTVELQETFYPSAQCRLDTMIAGLLEQERPRCWYAP